jgi:hypothetical protein
MLKRQIGERDIPNVHIAMPDIFVEALNKSISERPAFLIADTVGSNIVSKRLCRIFNQRPTRMTEKKFKAK